MVGMGVSLGEHTCFCVRACVFRCVLACMSPPVSTGPCVCVCVRELCVPRALWTHVPVCVCTRQWLSV